MLFNLKLGTNSFLGVIGYDSSVYWELQSITKTLGYKTAYTIENAFNLRIEHVASDIMKKRCTEACMSMRIMNHRALLCFLQRSKKRRSDYLFKLLNGCDFFVIITETTQWPLVRMVTKDTDHAIKFYEWIELFKQNSVRAVKASREENLPLILRKKILSKLYPSTAPAEEMLEPTQPPVLSNFHPSTAIQPARVIEPTEPSKSLTEPLSTQPSKPSTEPQPTQPAVQSPLPPLLSRNDIFVDQPNLWQPPPPPPLPPMNEQPFLLQNPMMVNYASMNQAPTYPAFFNNASVSRPHSTTNYSTPPLMPIQSNARLPSTAFDGYSQCTSVPERVDYSSTPYSPSCPPYDPPATLVLMLYGYPPTNISMIHGDKMTMFVSKSG